MARTSRAHASGIRFPSKRDLWVELLLLGGVAMLMSAIVVVVRDPTVGVLAGLGTVALCVAGIAFSLWVLYGTTYGFRGESLDIRCGPVRWTVPLYEIDHVRPSRNPLSAPAVSLDRLEIRYRDGAGSILISPADKAGFLRALVARAPQLRVHGDEAVREDEAR